MENTINSINQTMKALEVVEFVKKINTAAPGQEYITLHNKLIACEEKHAEVFAYSTGDGSWKYSERYISGMGAVYWKFYSIIPDQNIIKDWKDQNEYFGLDYSTSIAKVKDYKFDIRYDCDLSNPKIHPVKCRFTLVISYKNKIVLSKFGSSIDFLKDFSEKWFKDEIKQYHSNYCVLIEGLT